VVVDRSGALRWSWLAEPFGHSHPVGTPIGGGEFVLNLRMPGQYFDVESGLLHNWHRQYDASVGRYTQSDPIGLQGGINTYAYAEGNPASLIDPLGLATYMCTQPLQALGAAGRIAYAPTLNPLHHQFIGIVRPDGSVITGGQDRARGLWGPGKPSEGDGTPGSGAECKKVEDDNECLERCLMARFAASRPRYSLALQGLTGGQNCQRWADSTLAQCQASCKGKR
jgi:RHS repeat-associated protein